MNSSRQAGKGPSRPSSASPSVASLSNFHTSHWLPLVNAPSDVSAEVCARDRRCWYQEYAGTFGEVGAGGVHGWGESEAGIVDERSTGAPAPTRSTFRKR